MAGDPLLRRPSALSGVVDHRGHPVYRSNSSVWTSALFIIGVEISERFAYYGISSNLITYPTGPLRESTADVSAAVNVWSGAASMLLLVGAFVADSLLGCFRTIVLASHVYILDTEPSKRLGAGPDGYAALKIHPFFKGINWKNVRKGSTPKLSLQLCK